MTQAGYKETRVYTPESEKRIIKRTLDEDDEINALYGAFGLTPSKSSGVHPRTTITEPSLPMKSSSSLLRRLALQNVPDVNDRHDAPDAWWGGGIASSFGRAAKAVMDKSPQPQSTEELEDTHAPAEVGLGLAKGGGGVKRMKSIIEAERLRRGVTEEPPQQEQRPPVMRSLSESPRRSPEFKPPSASVQALVDSTPAPAAIDDAVYGFSPLPIGYEDQCDEDDAMYSAMEAFQVGSLGSSTANSSISIRNVDSMTLNFGSGSTVKSLADGPGQRVLLNTVEYDDEFDSPKSHALVLPLVDDDESDSSDAEPEATVCRPDIRRISTEPEPVPHVEEPRQLKYGDRATKLRMARSTPALKRQQSGWLDSVRSAVWSRAGYAPLETEPPVPVSTFRGPMRISPAVPVAPKLVVTSPVICDSVSTEAEDLPAIPSSIGATTPNDSYVPLRLRPSLAALRVAVGLPERKAIDTSTPVLSPRLDWKAQGSQFAGWNWEKDKDGGEWATRAPTSESDLKGHGIGIKMPNTETIDYSKSFFYKPATPPHPSHRTAARASGSGSETEAAAPAGDIPRKEPAMGKRRSIKSLRAALLLPVAPPPVPSLPSLYRAKSSSNLPPCTPPMKSAPSHVEAPILAISSPGAWEAGLPPRQLVLEGEEWDARDGGAPGDWGKKVRKGRKKVLSKKRSYEA